MAEKVRIRMNREFQTEIWYSDPHEPESDELFEVHRVHKLTPYGHMLIGLAGCSAQVVISYANNHDVPLERIEMEAAYHREKRPEGGYRENIVETAAFQGDLSEEQRQKLFKISEQCSIHRQYRDGINIRTELVDELASVG